MRTLSASKSAAQKRPRKPLPPKIAALLRESWWLLLVGAALYLVLILFTYNQSDPGWSHQASGAQVANAGGKAGAWMADILLFVFGLSAWWWVFFLLAAVVWGYRRLDAPETDRRPLAVAELVHLLHEIGLRLSGERGNDPLRLAAGAVTVRAGRREVARQRLIGLRERSTGGHRERSCDGRPSHHRLAHSQSPGK